MDPIVNFVSGWLMLVGFAFTILMLIFNKPLKALLYPWWNKRLLTPTYVILFPGAELEKTIIEHPYVVYKRLAFIIVLFPVIWFVANMITNSVTMLAFILFGTVGKILVLALYLAVCGLLGVLPGILYFVYDWERLHKKFVATTAWVMYRQAKFIWLGLILPQAKVRGSDGKSEQLRETTLATDIEDLTGQKTGWVEDFLDSLAFSWRGIACIRLNSNYIGAAELLKQIGNADWVVNVMKRIQMLSEAKNVRYGSYLKMVQEATLGKIGGTQDDVQKLMTQLHEFKARNRDLDPAQVTVLDFWAIEDPGKWVYPSLNPQPTTGAHMQYVVDLTAPMPMNAPAV